MTSSGKALLVLGVTGAIAYALAARASEDGWSWPWSDEGEYRIQVVNQRGDRLAGWAVWHATPEQARLFGPRMPDVYVKELNAFLFEDPNTGQMVAYEPPWTVRIVAS